MSEPTARYHELLRAVEGIGDPRPIHHWHEGTPDYVAEFDLGASDVAPLLEISQIWATREEWPQDDRDMTVYAPVHAWRMLGQLGELAVSATDALLEMIPRMEEREDDWYLNEFPDVLAMIGATVLSPTATLLVDSDRQEFVRICAADVLLHLAQRDPTTRDAVVTHLERQLGECDAAAPTLNAFVISYLLDLKARSAAAAMERTFADERVDLTVRGDWWDVREELEVDGSGLLPEQRPHPKPNYALEAINSSMKFDPATLPAVPSGNRQERRRERKRQRQNRKRNRRR